VEDRSDVKSDGGRGAGTVPHITVCTCTFNRPHLLKRLLQELDTQETAGSFTCSVVVSDNDKTESARKTVADFAAGSAIEVAYCVEPERNIALARNKALELAKGGFVAFIDDDEFPEKSWLLNLYRTCVQRQVAGALGPVKPYFEQDPPAWVRQGRFFERPEHPTGFVLNWERCRTGNVLLRRSILEGVDKPFNRDFGTGGEDKDFFMRMTQMGSVFVWCNEAVAYELVPPSRCKRGYLLNRALCRGKNILKHPVGRYRVVATSLVAAPLYALGLPLALLAGQAQFMKYAVKFCDHAGRLLALMGLNPISERRM
jgi:glycosyltransferase involved in cell wall biosynthesis